MKLQYLGFVIAVLLFTSCNQLLGFTVGCQQGEQKPNVILIITDDQGFGDLGYHGNEILQTPNINDFFEESVRATNFHVSPTCSPTRGALMTGRYSNRVGTWHTIGGRSLLFEDEITLPQIFVENGYVTGMFGKWHLGDNYPFRPEDRGFQEVVRHGGGGIAHTPDYWGNDYFDDTYWHNGKAQKYEGYCTDVFFNEAIKFIEEHKSQPFMTYIATNAAHGPFHVPEKYYNIYKNEDRLLDEQKRFYGMITNIDDNVGRLEEKLKFLGIAEKTVVIFMSDNGSARGFLHRDGEVSGYNAGLRGTKGSAYDGGHRVPYAIRWPDGNIKGGKEVDNLLAHIDLLPTLVDICNLSWGEDKHIDGKSFADLLREERVKWSNRTLIVDSQRTKNLVKWRRSAVMDDNWRLINGQELYNIKEDVSQSNDIASEHPKVVNKLRESYNKWWTSLMEQEVNERYAYIKAGTEHENPLRLSSHDMYIYPYEYVWHQNGVLEGNRGQGDLKVEVVKGGRYQISLRRYPRESGLAFNEIVSAGNMSVEISNPMPASKHNNLTYATLYLAGISETKPILGDSIEEVNFEGYIPAGKYDMTAVLLDADGRVYPSYYTYIERMRNGGREFEK
ncbi:arylsulfatase [Membranihabitans maritimus]|uniref:arylsulfatase n=1 Tax=Membranihabitans maritimus TaxID=2904244 RepID=UPI001F239328|nr:arylsulfatase [Membranihabitans maritimus]